MDERLVDDWDVHRRRCHVCAAVAKESRKFSKAGGDTDGAYFYAERYLEVDED